MLSQIVQIFFSKLIKHILIIKLGINPTTVGIVLLIL